MFIAAILIKRNLRVQIIQIERKNKKKDFPWGKVVLGVLITAAIVEGVLRFDPIKRQNMRKYKEIFTDPDRNKRNFFDDFCKR